MSQGSGAHPAGRVGSRGEAASLWGGPAPSGSSLAARREEGGRLRAADPVRATTPARSSGARGQGEQEPRRPARPGGIRVSRREAAGLGLRVNSCIHSEQADRPLGDGRENRASGFATCRAWRSPRTALGGEAGRRRGSRHRPRSSCLSRPVETFPLAVGRCGAGTGTTPDRQRGLPARRLLEGGPQTAGGGWGASELRGSVALASRLPVSIWPLPLPSAASASA